MKKILIIAATHGNEPLGIEILEKLKSKGLDNFFDTLIGNPKALEQKKEYIDINLNRIYPGKIDSDLYEVKKAAENLKIAKKYDYVIDLHEASKGKNDFIIVPREKLSEKFPLQYIDLDTVLIWPDPKGPLGEVLETCIELEFGMNGRDRNEAIEKGTKIIEEFIELIEKQKNRNRPSPRFRTTRTKKQNLYYVFGKLMAENFSGDINTLKDFKLAQINTEKFYPLLVGQYLEREGIVCYKMKKL